MTSGQWGSIDGQWGDVGRWWGGLSASADASYPQYHVRLAELGLLIAQGGYERRVGQQFAAKLGQGATTSADRVGDQVTVLDDWQDGEGYLRFDPTFPARYRAGAGIDIASEPGAVALGPHLATAQSTAFNELTVACVYGTKLYVGTSDGKVYSWDGATWTQVRDLSKAGGIRSMAVFQKKLYIGNGTDGTVASFDGTNWSNTAFTVSTIGSATVNGVRALCVHLREGVEYLYAIASTDIWGIVGYWDGSTMQTSDRWTTAEPFVDVAVVIGATMVVIGSDYTARRFGIYTLDNGGTFGKWEFQEAHTGSYIASAAVFDGVLYVGDAYDGRIWSWDGTKLELVRQIGTLVSPYGSAIYSMHVWKGGLYVGITEGQAGTVALLRLDKAGAWSRPVTGMTGTVVRGMASYGGNLFVLTEQTGAAKLYGTNDTYRASGQVESGLIDAGLPDSPKLWRSVTIAHSALVASQSVEVQYRLEDTGDWTTLGTSSTVGATGATFAFDDPTSGSLIAFRILLAGPAGGATPLLVFSLTARYVSTPTSRREWKLEARLEGNTLRRMELQDGSAEASAGAEISANLWALVDAAAPIEYLDIDRRTYTVRIVDYSEVLAPVPNTNFPTVGAELRGRLALAEI